MLLMNEIKNAVLEHRKRIELAVCPTERSLEIELDTRMHVKTLWFLNALI